MSQPTIPRALREEAGFFRAGPRTTAERFPRTAPDHLRRSGMASGDLARCALITRRGKGARFDDMPGFTCLDAYGEPLPAKSGPTVAKAAPTDAVLARRQAMGSSPEGRVRIARW